MFHMEVKLPSHDVTFSMFHFTIQYDSTASYAIDFP